MSAVDVLAVMDQLIRYYRQKEGLIGPVNDAYSVNHHNARVYIDELIEAHKDSVDEIIRLRDAMFRVYKAAASGVDLEPVIESMRDEMDKPWSIGRSKAAIAQVQGGAK